MKAESADSSKACRTVVSLAVDFELLDFAIID